jgi:hypothetical protein
MPSTAYMLLSLLTFFVATVFFSISDLPDKEAHKDFINKTGEYYRLTFVGIIYSCFTILIFL